jgi:cytochrome c-type biogenesis protein
VTPLDLAGWAESAVGGSMPVAVPVALLAGLVSFFSPCVVPLLPGYLSYATGLGAAEVLQGTRRRGRMLAGTSLFVLGIAAVFVTTGTLVGSVGSTLLRHTERVGQRERRISRLPAAGVAAAPLLGVVFALGWTPCIGPTLGVVYSLALNEGTALRGGLLAFVFALGLGIPFVVAGLVYTRMASAVGFLRRHQLALLRTGGVLMVLVGLLLVTGLWTSITAALRSTLANFTPVI